MRARAGAPGLGGVRFFGRLGRWLVRHPWYPVIFWVALLVVTVPFLPLLGRVTTNSATNVPTNAPSSRAAAEFADLFPQKSSAASSILLFYGPNLTDANAQAVVMNVTGALAADASLQDVVSIDSVYTDYGAYLTGQVELAGGVLAAGLRGPAAVPVAINDSSTLLWAPPAAFLADWQGRVANGSAPGPASYAAFESTNASLTNATVARLFAGFYAAFNATDLCWSTPATVVGCSDGAARGGEGPLLPTLLPPSQVAVAVAVLGGLGVENWTAWPSIQSLASAILAASSGAPAGFLRTVWNAFPGGVVSPSGAAAWASAEVARSTLASEPLPVPEGILARFVAPDGQAQVVNVGFSVADNQANASGGDPVYSDLGSIDQLVPSVVRAHDTTMTIRYLQTGGAALDLLTQTSVNESIALVLPITVGLLLAIAMIYFRSPLTPLVTFAALGMALALALGGTVLVGTLVNHVDTTSITLEEVFVLGVGTDYSIFLTARYREELIQGKSNDEAIVASVSWAGQSVATSGSTAIIATLALAFSGVALLSQWGSVLSLAILITLLMSLTIIPAFLKLIGPRIFWPNSGERFSRHAVTVSRRQREERTYFYRAGRLTQRRPILIVGMVLLVSVPLIAVALSAPLSYDFYDQLPQNAAATQGLSELSDHFGAGFATPSYALVTFSAPLVVANSSNATEFTDAAALTDLAGSASGIGSVSSLVGSAGAPLSTWLNLSTLPSVERANLLAVYVGFVGTDGRTVLFDLVPSSSGLSESAVAAVGRVSASFSSFQLAHPEVTGVSYGGGAPVIRDLAHQTAVATEFLIAAVTVGLIAVLLVVLRSWIIAVMAVATIGLSISWAWALTYLFFEGVLGFPIFFYVQTLLIILVLGLGIDYNIFVLTRVREERLRGRSPSEAAVEAVARTGGIITAAAVILACAFAALLAGSFTLIRAIGFSVAIAVVLDAMVVRTYLVPASLHLLGDRVWALFRRRPSAPTTYPPGSSPPPGTIPGGRPSSSSNPD